MTREKHRLDPAVTLPPAERPSLEDECQLTVRLGQILPLLADAVSNGRAWLVDFGDEPVRVSEDLYDVILAYQHFQEI